jgi:hypothetical protein
MKRHIAWMAILGSLAVTASAGAQPAGSETITTTMSFPSFPSSAPFVGNYSGTFMASGAINDSGTVSVQARFGAVPSPATGVLQTVRTLSGDNGTLTLRCNQRLFPHQTTVVELNAGSCVVLEATGAYAGFRGSGRLTGTTDFGVTPVTIQDTLVLGQH